MGQTMNVLWKG